MAWGVSRMIMPKSAMSVAAKQSRLFSCYGREGRDHRAGSIWTTKQDWRIHGAERDLWISSGKSLRDKASRLRTRWGSNVADDFMVHAPGGFWPIVNKGEPAILFCFVFLYIASRGSGRLSVDALATRERL